MLHVYRVYQNKCKPLDLLPLKLGFQSVNWHYLMPRYLMFCCMVPQFSVSDINEIHSQIFMENKTVCFKIEFVNINKRPRQLIGQTAITWPLHAVFENRGKGHFKLFGLSILRIKKNRCFSKYAGVTKFWSWAIMVPSAFKMNGKVIRLCIGTSLSGHLSQEYTSQLRTAHFSHKLIISIEFDLYRVSQKLCSPISSKLAE
jgi:hypothetical protein